MTARHFGLTGAALAGSALAWIATVAVVGTPSRRAEAAPAPAVEAAPAPAQGGGGTIKGKLVYGGAQAPTPEVLVKKGDNTKQDPQVCAAEDLLSRELVVDPRTKGIRHAFAYLKAPIAGSNPAAEKALLDQDPEVIVDQRNCEFIPYATAMFAGQKAIFKSSDPVGHNVRYNGLRSGGNNVTLPPNGELKVDLKGERVPIEVRCDIHPWMKGWVLPLDHPFFATTDEDGSFEIKGVPAGAQTLLIWQEKVGYVEGSKGKAVTVQAGQTVDVGSIVLDPGKIKK